MRRDDKSVLYLLDLEVSMLKEGIKEEKDDTIELSLNLLGHIITYFRNTKLQLKLKKQ